jgi:DNA-directed RNA polymerase subunit RPC12/RpoP
MKTLEPTEEIKQLFAKGVAAERRRDADNRCSKCRRIVVGLKPGDMHDHVEDCPHCGRMREMEPTNKEKP